MTPVEQYASEVVSYLGRLPRRVRRQMERELTQELNDYPEAESSSALEARFGSPVAYAVTLASDLDIRPGRTQVLTWRRGLSWATGALIGLWLVAAFTVPIGHGPWHNFGEFEAIDAQVPFSDFEGVRFEEGKRATLYFSIVNRGRFPVTVLDFGVFPARRLEDRLLGWNGPLVQGAVSFQLYREPGGVVGDYMDTIELLPRDAAGVAVETLMTNCDTNAVGSSTGHSKALVTFSYLGLVRSVEIAVPGLYTTIPDPCRGTS